jgi:hypothetical protein
VNDSLETHIYQCELCGEQLGPQAQHCLRCGLVPEHAVPDDAAPPSCPFTPHPHGSSAAARATIILAHTNVPSWLPTLRRLTRHWEIL